VGCRAGSEPLSVQGKALNLTWFRGEGGRNPTKPIKRGIL